jgi:hypothetical protein
MNTMNTAILLELKSSLEWMVETGRMEEAEMFDILRRAGLAKLPEGEGWIDESGARYHHH